MSNENEEPNDKIFLTMEGLLALELEETKAKYGVGVAALVRNLHGCMMQGIAAIARANPDIDAGKLLMAYIETMAGWNARIDKVAKREHKKPRLIKK